MPSDNDTISDDVPTIVTENETAPLAPPSRAPVVSAPRYVTRRVIGKGGMGEVRLCSDLRIGRDVAMKVMRESTTGSTGLRERFEREARLQGQLEHPAIVPVYDLGEGASWFTMKRVRGHTLEQIVQGLATSDPLFTEKFTVRRMLVAFVQVTQAIAFAHSRGIVHRDLKPANIMLGDFGEVYVLDWGLGKVLGTADVAVDGDDVPTRAGLKTAAGALLGTPGYMPPEQARGRHEDLDVRADVYALGAILYEILALEPFHPRGTIEEVIHSTMMGADPFASEVNDRAPPELDRVIERATALDRNDRYPSARELAIEIERFLDGERDLTVRKKLAAQHIDEARAAKTPGEAMRSLHRAITVDPDAGDAMGALAEMLLNPSTDPPPDALDELYRTREQEQRRTARFGVVAFLSWFLVTPVLFWGGFRGLSWIALVAMFAAPALGSLWLARRAAPPDEHSGLLVLLASTLTIAFASLHFGPFVLVPGWAAQNTLIFAMQATPGPRRATIIALGTLAFAMPLGLELLSILPPSFAFEAGKLVVSSRVLTLQPLPTLLVLSIATIALIVIPSLIVARAHDDAWEAKKRLAAHLWHVRQLVPAQPPRGQNP
jgi:eukaryotic-like serine/threonine-protein kinase